METETMSEYKEGSYIKWDTGTISKIIKVCPPAESFDYGLCSYQIESYEDYGINYFSCIDSDNFVRYDLTEDDKKEIILWKLKQ
jgi:hypothetical protein